MAENSNHRDEFPLEDNLIYLNHAAVSPWPRRTAVAVQKFAEENMVRGARRYMEWLAVEIRLRSHLQQLLNAPSSDDIALVKNTSEALSMVAYGLDWKEGDNIVSTNQEFPSNRIVWESLSRFGVEFREADLYGESSPEDALFSLIDTRTRLITISSVQYATGLRMALVRIGEFCQKNNILFCVDAIQSLGAVDLDVQEINADFVMADGHKWMLGPEGLAVFYCHREARDRLRLNEYGWHMIEEAGCFDTRQWHIAESARRFECGSPNMLGIVALSESLSLILEAGIKEIEKMVLEKSAYLLDRIGSDPNLELITQHQSGRYAGIVSFRSHGVDPSFLYEYLMERGVVCSKRAGGIRFSPHFYVSEEKLAQAIDLIKTCHEESV